MVNQSKVDTENTGKNMPEKKFSTGAITATVWKNQGTTKQGEATEFKTISLQRRYTDKNGVWKSSSSLRMNDLPRAALVINKAYEYLVLREKEPVTAYEEEMVL